MRADGFFYFQPMSQAQLEYRLIGYGSDYYRKTLDLRDRILRIPLGLRLTERELADDATDMHIGCFAGEQLVACLIMSPKPDNSVKMRQVAVDEGWQRKGIGARLVRFADAWAAEEGFDKVWCHARDVARKFYLGLGYQVVGAEFEQVGIPHYHMERSLKA